MNAITRRIALSLLGQKNPDLDTYYTALGEFIHAFSDAEETMQVTLWHLAGVKEPVAQALFSGVKIEGAISYVYRISEAKRWKESRKTRYKFLFDQLQIINKLRNDVVHRGASLQEDGTWLSTNARFVHVPERVTMTPVSAEILNNATTDLFEIRFRLMYLNHGHRFSAPIKKNFRNFLKHAWLYKSVPQGRKAHVNRGIHRKRPHQQKSSLARS